METPVVSKKMFRVVSISLGFMIILYAALWAAIVWGEESKPVSYPLAETRKGMIDEIFRLTENKKLPLVPTPPPAPPLTLPVPPPPPQICYWQIQKVVPGSGQAINLLNQGWEPFDMAEDMGWVANIKGREQTLINVKILYMWIKRRTCR